MTVAEDRFFTEPDHLEWNDPVLTIGGQMEFGWRFNPAEARDAHGRWTRDGVGYEMPAHDRLISQRSPYHDPADHPFFKTHPVSSKNIVTTYDRSTASEKAQGMRWYADAHDVAGDIAHGDSVKGGAMLATYSPQTSWPVNMYNASRALAENRALGPGDGMITGAMQRTAQKVLDGQDIDHALKAPKTNAFAHLIANGGDAPDEKYGHVVIDRHAMSVAVGKRLTKVDLGNAPIGDDRYYELVADEYRKAAAEVNARGGDQVSPHQMQAITWLHQQAANQAQDDAGGASAPGGKGFAKGRQTALRNAWDKWGSYASAHGIDTEKGTTALVNTVMSQLVELSTIGQQVDEPSTIAEQVDLAMGAAAAWKHELRDPKTGKWVGDAATKAGLAGIHQQAQREHEVRTIAQQAAVKESAVQASKTRQVLRTEQSERDKAQDEAVQKLTRAVREANHRIQHMEKVEEKHKAHMKTAAVIGSILGGAAISAIEAHFGLPDLVDMLSAALPGIIESIFEMIKRL